MSGWVDLHAHWVPGVDDGVPSFGDALAVCQGLGQLGYAHLVVTPHIRTAMFPNEPEGLREAFEALVPGLREAGVTLRLSLAAEHFFDDVLLERVAGGRLLPYPGGRAFLVELPDEPLLPMLERWFFQLRVRGLRPVLAHPERCRALWRHPDALERLIGAGAAPQLDLMSLTGRYGRRPQAFAEHFLDAGHYAVAGSDVHRPADVDVVGRAIERLQALVGEAAAAELLREGPTRLLEGAA